MGPTSGQVCPPKTSPGLLFLIAHHSAISPGHGKPQHLMPGGFEVSLCGDVAGSERVHLGLMKHLVWRDMGDVAQPEGTGASRLPSLWQLQPPKQPPFLEGAGLKLESKSWG